MDKISLIVACVFSAASIIINLINSPTNAEQLGRQVANPAASLIGMLIGAALLGLIVYKLLAFIRRKFFK